MAHPQPRPKYNPARAHGSALRALRIAGLVAMAVGILFVVATFASYPLMRMFVQRRTESRVEFYVIVLFLGLLSGIGPMGVMLFEASRLFGFERRIAEARQGRSAAKPG